MTKKEMIKELIKAWCLEARDKESRAERFIIHDSKENKLDRMWTKDGIKMIYNKYLEDPTSISFLIQYYTI